MLLATNESTCFYGNRQHTYILQNFQSFSFSPSLASCFLLLFPFLASVVGQWTATTTTVLFVSLPWIDNENFQVSRTRSITKEWTIVRSEKRNGQMNESSDLLLMIIIMTTWKRKWILVCLVCCCLFFHFDDCKSSFVYREKETEHDREGNSKRNCW